MNEGLMYLTAMLLMRQTGQVNRIDRREIIANMNLNLTTLFKGSQMTTAVALFNESIFHHLQEDTAQPGIILACLDNAVVRINVREMTVSPYSGISNMKGYREGAGHHARYKVAISLAQLNESIVVADRDNFCLRKVDRKTVTSSEYAGRCRQQNISPQSMTDVMKSDLRLMAPQALLYEKGSKTLYFADRTTIYLLNTTNSRAYTLLQDDKYMINSLVQSADASDIFFATVNSGIVRINKNSKDIKIIAGHTTASDQRREDDDTFSRAIFNGPQAIIHLYANLYITGEYGSSRLRGLDMYRNKTQTVCNGEAGYRDGSVDICELYQPTSLLFTNHTLYVGERGTYGGGLRVISTQSVDNTYIERRYGIAVLILVGSLTAIAAALVILARWFTAKIDRIPKNNTEPITTKYSHLYIKSMGADGALLAAQINMQETTTTNRLTGFKGRPALDDIEEDPAIEYIKNLQKSNLDLDELPVSPQTPTNLSQTSKENHEENRPVTPDQMNIKIEEMTSDQMNIKIEEMTSDQMNIKIEEMTSD